MRKLALLLLVALGACGINTSPGDGEKVGQIVKLGKVGMFTKTWEAEIIRGGFQSASGVSGRAFDFTVENDYQAEELRSLMESQTEVRIKYRSEGVWSVSRSESNGHFLVSIEPVRTPTIPR